jgi:hypothetical protein
MPTRSSSFQILLEVFLCEASLFRAAAVHARVEVVLLAALLRGLAALVFAAFLIAAGTRLATAAFALLAPAFTAVSTKAPATLVATYTSRRDRIDVRRERVPPAGRTALRLRAADFAAAVQLPPIGFKHPTRLDRHEHDRKRPNLAIGFELRDAFG